MFSADPVAPDLQVKSLMNVLMLYNDTYLMDALLRLDMMPEDPNDVFQNACAWKKTTCDEKGSITIMYWRGIGNLPLDISWLPPTLMHANLHFKAVDSYQFPTRRLPRTLVTCEFSSCRLRGSLDLETLPAVIEVLDLHYNYFAGTVRLTKLPETMQGIDLSGNDIRKVVVRNASIPPCLRQVSFERNRSFDFLPLDGWPVDKRINERRYKGPRQQQIDS